MKNLLKTLLFLLISNLVTAQSANLDAQKLRKDGDLSAAIEAYKKNYNLSPENKENTYNLACAFALAYQIDSAYHYLHIALKEDTSLWALADSDLFALINDPRWEMIENQQIKKFQAQNPPIKEVNYAKALLKIIIKDQALDYYIDQAKNYYMTKGKPPHWYFPIGAFKQEIIKENFGQMQQLIKQYGWPTYSTVGKLAADAPLLVINHHENPEIRKQFLPQIKKACMDKEGSCMEYAKIQDRILVEENKPQLYGMQFRYNAARKLEPFPIKDPESVDQRRKAIGLEPLKDYLKRKIDYDWE
jgi:hypothetical protein